MDKKLALSNDELVVLYDLLLDKWIDDGEPECGAAWSMLMKVELLMDDDDFGLVPSVWPEARTNDSLVN